MIIAVDFDGTIVRDRYPQIGNEMPFATDTLRMLLNEGHQLVLWTVRQGKELEEAIAWCRERGVEFYAVNKTYPGEDSSEPFYSRKIKADIFIDDRNVGGMLDWGTIYEIIKKHKTLEEVLFSDEEYRHKGKKRSWWQF